MMGSRGALKGDEWDVLTGWRKLLILKPSLIRRAKRSFNRRMRRETREALRRDPAPDALTDCPR